MATFLKQPLRLLILLIIMGSTAYAQQNLLRAPGVVVSASPTPLGSLGLFNDGYTGNIDVYYNVSSLGDSVWVQFQLPSPQVAAAYQIYWWSGGSTYGANNILLYGSSDGSNWQLVNQTQGDPPPLAVGFDNATAYSYYRFVFKQYRSGSYLDFNEIELYNNDISAPVLAFTSTVGDKINLSWNATVIGAGSYELQKSTNGTDFTLLKAIDVPGTTYTDTALIQATSYWYRIRAIKGTTISDFSAVLKATTANDTLKTTPTLTATAGNIGTLANIVWNLTPFNTPGSFQLERSTDGVNFTPLLTVDKAIKNYADSSLQQASSYWYRVKGTNYTSSSPYSPSVKVTTISDALVTRPTLTATPGNLGTFATLIWRLTPFNTAGTYQLEKSTDGINFTPFKTFDKTITNYADSSLARSTSYWYRVRAINYTSTSAYSDIAKVTTVSDSLLTAPSLTAIASSLIGTRATLSWSLAISLSGSFELEKSTNGTDFILFKTFDKSVTSYTDSTLTHNTMYWYRVRGRNEVSPSPYSVTRQITTRNDSLLVAPVLQATAPTGTNVNLSWSFPISISGDGGFEVEKSTNGTDFVLLGKFPPTTTAYTEESLTPNTNYWYRIRAFNYINTSDWSAIIPVTTNSFTSTPADITDDGGNLFVSAENSGGADADEGSTKLIDNNFLTKWLVFTGQASGNLSAVYRPAGSYIVTGYSLTTAGDATGRDPRSWLFEGSNDSLVWNTLDARSNQFGGTTPRNTTFHFTLADPGSIAFRFYRITFTQNNGAFDGVRFQVAEWQIFGLDPAAPDIPTNLSVTATTVTSVSLGWTGGTVKPATKFVLQRSTDHLYFTTVDSLDAAVLAYTDAGLYDSTNYYYRIQALGTGTTAVSGWSNVAMGLTKFTPGTPITPVSLTIGTVEDSIVNLSWIDRSYNETGFRLQRSTDNVSFTDLQTLPANTNAATDATVWPATNYYYRIAAVNGSISSGYSNVDSVLTTGSNRAPQPTVPLLIKNACSTTSQITGYISGLIPGTLLNEKTQQLRITNVRAADTTSANYFSSLSFTPAVTEGVATYSFTGAGFGNAGDTARLIVTIKDNGGTESGGKDSLLVPVDIVFVPLTVMITPDRDVTSLSKYVSAQLLAATNYASSNPRYSWADAEGIEGNRSLGALRVRPIRPVTYTVTAVNDNGCTATAQILVTPDQEKSISNVLTPNGDGKNDKWIVWGITQNQNNSVKVFDRGGRLVFYQKNYSNDWEGRYKGKLLEEGIYYYVVDYGDGAKPVTGTVNILYDHR